jgi:hypothetical protein
VRQPRVLLATLATLVAGCTYYNSIYNAERLFEEAESRRRAGEDSAAAELYQDVVRKAAHGYRREPGGDWAYEALFLLGRARLRMGEVRAARAALEEAAALARTPEERLSSLVYLGIAEESAGEADLALARFDEALAGSTVAAARGEGHLHRGRILLARGSDAGWRDLERAASLDAELRLEAAVEGLRWGIETGERERAAESVRRLLSYSEAGARLDTVVALLHGAEERWSARTTADFLEPVGDAPWGPTARGRLALERARMFHRAQDTAAAGALARRVADGVGEPAASARLQLARWRLPEATDLADAYTARRILLPAGDDPRVAALIASIDTLDALALAGVDEPLAWFAAGEIARERLGAPLLARSLFLAYADGLPNDAWTPKALLAALALSPAEEDRAWLRSRLEPYAGSPYVLAARGRPAAGYEALEEELVVRLNEIPLP